MSRIALHVGANRSQPCSLSRHSEVFHTSSRQMLLEQVGTSVSWPSHRADHRTEMPSWRKFAHHSPECRERLLGKTSPNERESRLLETFCQHQPTGGHVGGVFSPYALEGRVWQMGVVLIDVKCDQLLDLGRSQRACRFQHHPGLSRTRTENVRMSGQTAKQTALSKGAFVNKLSKF